MKSKKLYDILPAGGKNLRSYGVFLFSKEAKKEKGSATFRLDYATYNKKEAERIVAYHTRDKVPAIFVVYKLNLKLKEFEIFKQIDNPIMAPFLAMINKQEEKEQALRSRHSRKA